MPRQTEVGGGGAAYGVDEHVRKSADISLGSKQEKKMET